MKKFFALLVAAALICALTIGVVSCDFGSKSNGKPFDPATSSTQEFYEYIMERFASGDGHKNDGGTVIYTYNEYYYAESEEEVLFDLSFDPETNEVYAGDIDSGDRDIWVDLNDYSVEDMRWREWYWHLYDGRETQEDRWESCKEYYAFPAERAAEAIYYIGGLVADVGQADSDIEWYTLIDTLLYHDLVKLEKSDHISENFEKLTDESSDKNEYPASYYENTYKIVLNEETVANFDASKYELDEDVFQDPAIRYLDVMMFNGRDGLVDIESVDEAVEELYFVFDENNELCQIIFYISNNGRINAINF